MTHIATQPDSLLAEIRALIEDARRQIAHAANAGLTLTYWRIGKRLLTENLTDGRGEYGQRILASLAQQLEREYGKGFSYSALTRMARFAVLRERLHRAIEHARERTALASPEGDQT